MDRMGKRYKIFERKAFMVEVQLGFAGKYRYSRSLDDCDEVHNRLDILLHTDLVLLNELTKNSLLPF